MNIKALITTLFVVGSSTAALAQPASQGSVDVRDHRGYEQPAPTPAPAPIVRDHRTEAPTPAPIVRDHRDEITQVQPVAVDHDRDHDRDQRKLPSWMMLSSSDAIGRNGSDYIRIESSTALRTLKLQATSGKTTVSQIAIKFANGRSQVVYPNQTIGSQNAPSLTVDLNGNARNVVGITVYGSSRHGSFEVLGS